MIHFLVTRAHAYTIRLFAETWGRPIRWRLRTIFYDDLPRLRSVKGGVYIFTDLERLDALQLELAAGFADQISAANPPAHVLNHPRKVLRRFDLLSRLHAQGLNEFAVHRVYSDPGRWRFPVFLRLENEHDGSQTALLQSREDVARDLATLQSRDIPREHLIAIEYCETAINGAYRKYAVLRLGNVMIPRHLLFTTEWITKFPGVVDPDKVAEEELFLTDNPHKDQLGPIFTAGQIDYGRIDYGIKNGRVQTWEINTNPVITTLPMSCAAEHLPGLQRFATRVNDAFEALDESHTPINGSINVRFPKALLDELGFGKICRTRESVRRGLRKIGVTSLLKRARHFLDPPH